MQYRNSSRTWPYETTGGINSIHGTVNTQYHTGKRISGENILLDMPNFKLSKSRQGILSECHCILGSSNQLDINKNDCSTGD